MKKKRGEYLRRPIYFKENPYFDPIWTHYPNGHIRHSFARNFPYEDNTFELHCPQCSSKLFIHSNTLCKNHHSLDIIAPLSGGCEICHNNPGTRFVTKLAFYETNMTLDNLEDWLPPEEWKKFKTKNYGHRWNKGKGKTPKYYKRKKATQWRE